MRTILSRLLVALLGAAVLAVTPLTPSHAAVPDHAGAGHKHHKPHSAQAAVAAMQPGWNLGNTFDSVGPDETAWGNPRVTRELLANVKDQGFNSIRIPVTWDGHHSEAPDYTIDPEWLDRVQEVVGWALDEGLWVMLNMHHDSWLWVHELPTQHDTVLARYTALWTQIAEAFQDASPKLVLESINEPTFSGSSGPDQEAALMDELNTTFHQIVRGSGGDNATRLLVLPSLHTSVDDQRWVDDLADTIAALDDPNLIATFHFYGFWPFSVNVAGYTRFNDEVQQDLVDRFNRARDTWGAAGIPVILGEYGLLGFDVHTGTVEQGEKLKFFEFFGHYAQQTDITTMLWDNGQHFGRTSFEWSDPALFRQIKSSWRKRSGTAETDLVFVEKAAGADDVTVTLNPHGHRFVGMTHGWWPLFPWWDYQIDGDQLTLSSRLLSRLTRDGEYGVNAELTVWFSRGVPWTLHIVTYDQPVLSEADGTTDAFAIPTTFNGDQLATMEAVYADGSFAGPHNWTSFKEFGRAFEPVYDDGEIVLTEDFFNEVNDDDPVTLTFHFWSGTTVDYAVTKSGTSVTGTA